MKTGGRIAIALFIAAAVVGGVARLPIYLSHSMIRSFRTAGQPGDEIEWRPQWSSLFEVIEQLKYNPGHPRWPLILDVAIVLGITLLAMLIVRATFRALVRRTPSSNERS